MASSTTSPVFLSLEATLALHTLDDWIDPLNDPPSDAEVGDFTRSHQRVQQVEVTYYSQADRAPESVIYTEVVEAENTAPGFISPDARFFLQRESIRLRHPISALAQIDLLDIGRVEIDKGLLRLGGEIFQAWELGQSAQADNADQAAEAPVHQRRWFFYGEEIPALQAAYFHPEGVPEQADWPDLWREVLFIRHHTRLPLAHATPLAHALSHPEDFWQWLVHLPEERIHQLMVSPSLRHTLRQEARMKNAAI